MGRKTVMCYDHVCKMFVAFPYSLNQLFSVFGIAFLYQITFRF